MSVKTGVGTYVFLPKHSSGSKCCLMKFLPSILSVKTSELSGFSPFLFVYNIACRDSRVYESALKRILYISDTMYVHWF